MARVFFSYRRSDSELAWKKIDLIKAFGFSVWEYRRQSEPSAIPPASMLAGLEDARMVVHLEPSEPADKDGWLRWELELAESKGVPVVCIRTRDATEASVGGGAENAGNQISGPSAGAAATGGTVVDLGNDEALIEAVAGRPIESFEERRADWMLRYRRGVLKRSAIVYGAVFVGFLLGALAGTAGPGDAPSAARTWWESLEAHSMVGIPAHLALVIGFFAVLQLMAITWSIGHALEQRQIQLADGQMHSWVAATALILGITGVGLHFAVCSSASTIARVILGLLSAVPVVLFVTDGFREGMRLSVIDRPKWVLALLRFLDARER